MQCPKYNSNYQINPIPPTNRNTPKLVPERRQMMEMISNMKRGPLRKFVNDSKIMKILAYHQNSKWLPSSPKHKMASAFDKKSKMATNGPH